LRDDIIHLAHHAAAEPDVWDRVMILMSEWLRAAQIALVEHNPLTQQGQIDHAAGLSEEFCALYRARFAAQNVWLKAVRGVAGDALTGTEIVPNWELVRSEFYRSWLRPQSAFHSLLGITDRRTDRLGCVIALRPADGEPFGSVDKQRLAEILRGLGCARDLESGLAAERRTAEVLVDLLDCLPDAVLLVDTVGRPILVNRAARVLLARRDPLVLTGGVLATASIEETRRLRRLIATASNGIELQDPAGGEIALSRKNGAPPLVLRIAALPHKIIDESGRTRAVAAVFSGPFEPAAIGRLCAFYHLTPAEARLAALIADGRTLLGAAASLRVTRNTARTHMKRIYAKTETHRQADLVRLLVAGRPSLR
jgi:DNA-binding CsgD family transcriptional regulator